LSQHEGDDPAAAPGKLTPKWPRLSHSTLKTLLNETVGEFFVGLGCTLIAAILGFTALGGRFADIYMMFESGNTAASEVALVTIGEDALYQWNPDVIEHDHTPRAMLGELVGILDEAGASVIVLDILLDRPEDGDDALAAAAKQHGAVVGAEQVLVTDPPDGAHFAAGITTSLQPHIQGAFANLHLEEPTLFFGEMVARGIPLIRRYFRASLKGEWPLNITSGPMGQTTVPSLALGGAWLHRVRESDATVNLSRLSAELEGADACGTVEPLDCSSSQVSGLPNVGIPLHDVFWLRYRGYEGGDGIPAIPASRLLLAAGQSALMAQLTQTPQPTALDPKTREQLADKLVFIGRVDRLGQDDADRFATPYAFPFYAEKDMAGVRIHAQAADALLNGRKLRTAPIWVTALLSVLIGGWMGWMLPRYRQRSAHQMSIWFATNAALIAVGFGAFVWTHGWVFELGIPITVSTVLLAGWHLLDDAKDGEIET
jgi:CHASE2 domain-containing sensor protein